MKLGLSGRVVFVSGASGGIGRAIAETFAGEGASLALHAYEHREALERWVKTRAWQDRCIIVRADVRSPDAMRRAMEATRKRFGAVDVCVVNAGIWPHEDVALQRMPAARIREVVGVNLLGAIWTAQAFLRALERTKKRSGRGGASLVFVGSTAGRFGESGHAEYAATKAALRGLTLTLKNEIVHLDPRGRVNLVEPGWTLTPMAEAGLRDGGVLARVKRTMALKRLARPEDVARAVAVLASPTVSRHVTGEFMMIAGGMEGRVVE